MECEVRHRNEAKQQVEIFINDLTEIFSLNWELCISWIPISIINAQTLDSLRKIFFFLFFLEKKTESSFYIFIRKIAHFAPVMMMM